MTKEIKTNIHIQARPAQVWAILLDFDQYPAWNPFILSAQGQAQEGTTLRIRVQPVGSRAMSFSPRVLVCAPPRHFRWKGQLLWPGIFDGEHVFELSENPDGSTTFYHSEQLSGWLVGLFDTSNTQAGFEAMNQALKERSEKKTGLF
jgi:hypothetical protein